MPPDHTANEPTMSEREARGYDDHRDRAHGGHTCPAEDWRKCEAVVGRRDLRDLVYREIVRVANDNPGFRAVVEPLGFFTFMALVDGIVDAVTTAQTALSEAAL